MFAWLCPTLLSQHYYLNFNFNLNLSAKNLKTNLLAFTFMPFVFLFFSSPASHKKWNKISPASGQVCDCGSCQAAACFMRKLLIVTQLRQGQGLWLWLWLLLWLPWRLLRCSDGQVQLEIMVIITNSINTAKLLCNKVEGFVHLLNV